MKNNFLIFMDFTRKLFKNRYMIWMMAMRDLKATYVGSIFGFMWAVINPLMQMAIYGVIFGVFFKSTPDPVYGTDSYILFLFCGLIPWQFFSQALGSSATVLVANSSLVKKAVGFPSEILPIVTVVSNIISHAIGLALLLALTLFTKGVLPAAAPLILIYLGLASLFAIGLGWIMSSANVFLRDIQQVLALALTAWLFFTPVVYSPGMVPANFLWVMKLNPIYHFVEGYRLALLAGRPLPPAGLAYLAASSVFTLAAGGIFFRRLKPMFAETL